MSTTIASPSADGASIRWQEPYVSDGLNRKLGGVAPAGVIRGGVLVTSGAGLNVRVDPDPDTGDSVYSYINANGRQVTFRQAGPVTLNLTPVAGTTVYVALYINYLISTATTVEWRAYTEAELFGGAPVVEAGEVIIVGMVVVPAVGPIASSDVSPSKLRFGSMSLSQGMRPWTQIIKNGSFDLAKAGALTGDHIPSWDGGPRPPGFTWSVVSTAPRGSRGYELQVAGTGVAADVGMRAQVLPAVRPGQRVYGRVWTRGDSWTGAPSTGYQGLRIQFFDRDANVLSTHFVTSTLSGTFDYTLADGVFEAPALAEFAMIEVGVDSDAVAMNGSIFFDDVTVWLENAADASDEDAAQRAIPYIGHGPVVPPGSFGDIDEYVAKTLLLKNTFPAGTVYQWLHRTTGLKWLMQLVEGTLEIGANLDTSDADRETPRIKTALSGSAKRILVWEAAIATEEAIRIYASRLAGGQVFELTVNARWDHSTSRWISDTTNNAYMFALDAAATFKGVYFCHENSAGAGRSWLGTTGPGGWTSYQVQTTNVGLGTAAVQILKNGTVSFVSPTSGNGSDESNIGPSGAPAINTVYSKNIAKSWGLLDTDGLGAVTVSGGFNCTASIVGTDIRVVFPTALANTNYAVTYGTEGYLHCRTLNKLTTGFDISVTSILTDANVDLSIGVASLSFHVDGTQS